MKSNSPIHVDVEFMTDALLDIAQERSVEKLLQKIVHRSLEMPAALITAAWPIDSEKEYLAGTPREGLWL